MSKALGMRCVWGLCGVLAAVLVFASATQAGVLEAEVSSDLSGSVVEFPKVLWTGPVSGGAPARDTIIQLSNTSNNLVHVHCFYINARRAPSGEPLWQVTDFKLWLSRQQPTHWVASRGRTVNPTDNFPVNSCSSCDSVNGFDLNGAGLDPGAVPPVPPGFEGELKCVQIDASGTPFGGNNLKGEAVLRGDNGDVSKYNAVAIVANPDLASGDPSNILRLDNTPAEDGEYSSCAGALLLDHFLDGVDNPVVQTFNSTWCTDPGDCPIRTELTLVPCSQDLENLVPGRVTVQFLVINEFEEIRSTSTTVDCWLTTRLADIDAPTGFCTGTSPPLQPCTSDTQCIEDDNGFCRKQSIFSQGGVGTLTAFSVITPVALHGGVKGVAEDVYYMSQGTSVRAARAAADLHQAGNRFDDTREVEGGPVVDTIGLPPSNF